MFLTCQVASFCISFNAGHQMAPLALFLYFCLKLFLNFFLLQFLPNFFLTFFQFFFNFSSTCFQLVRWLPFAEVTCGFGLVFLFPVRQFTTTLEKLTLLWLFAGLITCTLPRRKRIWTPAESTLQLTTFVKINLAQKYNLSHRAGFSWGLDF